MAHIHANTVAKSQSLPGFGRRDIRIIELVDTYLPRAAKPVCDGDACLSCSHLIHRPDSGSICRKANFVGEWPVASKPGDSSGHCPKFLGPEDLPA